MKHHNIPNTDLSVSSLCYGVMRFGARVTGEAMHEGADLGFPAK